MPKGCISCLLCQGAISVRSGNLDKFRVHMESDHDVFFGHDILIAINFLEAHEKEIIIEKVLPRMKLLFANIRCFDGKFVPSDGKTGLEKRLLEMDDDSSGNPSKKLKPSKENEYQSFKELNSSIEISDVSDVNEEINIGDESDDDNIDDKISDEEIENDAVSVGDTLTESINSIKDILKGGTKVDTEDEFTTCDVCNLSVRKSILDFHRKSHQSVAKSTVAECDVCRKVMQKKSLNKHRRRCEIMSNLSKNNLSSEQDLEENNDDYFEQPASTVHDKSNHPKPEENDFRKSSNQCPICLKPMLKGNIRRHIRMVHGDRDAEAEVDFKCKICFTGFPQLDGLKLHTNQEHHLDLEDVEQMLHENSKDQSKRSENDERMINESYQGSVNLDPEILEKVMKSVEHDNSVGEYSEDVDAKKFKCEHCDNVYTNKDSVRRHRRKAHTSL